MKWFRVLSLVSVLSCVLPLAGHAATVFYIGADNNGTAGVNATTEFEQEGSPRVDTKYYWENGNYTTVSGITGSAGENWTAGMEPWLDAGSILGFARAITSSLPVHHIYFQLDATEVGPTTSLTFTIDFYGGGQAAGAPATSHDIDFYLDNVKFHTITGMTSTGQLMVVSGIDASLLSAGSHVLSWQRTGGVAGWINMDYLSLVSVPEPSRALLVLGGLGLMLVGWRRR